VAAWRACVSISTASRSTTRKAAPPPSCAFAPRTVWCWRCPRASTSPCRGAISPRPASTCRAGASPCASPTLPARAIAGSAPRAWAGAWTRDAGHGYVATGWSRILATSVFAGDGRTRPILRYEQNAWNLYGELGLVSRWLTTTVESTLVRDNAQGGEHTTG